MKRWLWTLVTSMISNYQVTAKLFTLDFILKVILFFIFKGTKCRPYTCIMHGLGIVRVQPCHKNQWTFYVLHSWCYYAISNLWIHRTLSDKYLASGAVANVSGLLVEPLDIRIVDIWAKTSSSMCWSTVLGPDDISSYLYKHIAAYECK